MNGGGKKGEAPWILLASGINSDTASVDEVPTTVNTVTPSSPNAPIGSIPPTGSGNNTNGSGGYRPSGSGGYTGGSGGSALVPVVGMYFLHPDHLGSITMITDGRGNVIAGGNNGGKSHISYTPYGSIHRTDSSGPDITRFKYTGQEEDKESGLFYYKARYYDPMVGRFLQADNLYDSEDTNGMNHYMYVNGSPMNFRDDTGNSCTGNYLGQVIGAIGASIGYMFGGPAGARAGYATSSAAFGIAPGHNWTGGGFGGNCGGKPYTRFALQLFLNKEGNPIKAFFIEQYLESQMRLGKPTFLDGLNTDRKSYTNALVGLVVSNQMLPEDAVKVFLLMTDGVRQPTNDIDRASYMHDLSRGRNVLGTSGHDPRAANSRWIKSAYKGIHNPYDALVAGTGIILFSLANAVYSVSHINRVKYDIKPGRFPKVCSRRGACNLM